MTANPDMKQLTARINAMHLAADYSHARSLYIEEPDEGPEIEDHRIAEILIDGGWRKPEVIHDSVNAQALPHGTVIRDREGWVAIKGDNFDAEFHVESYPITVLWSPHE